jgi:hypothetical protein
LHITSPASRGVLGLAYGALAGAVSAFLLAFALSHAGSVLVLIAYLSTIPLFMAGMGAGFFSCVVGAFIGTVSLFLVAPGSFGVFYLMANAVPTVILTALAMRLHRGSDGKLQYAAEGNVLAALAIYPCIIFLIIFIATMKNAGGLLTMTADALDGLTPQITDMLTQNGEKLTPDITLRIHQYLLALARMTPALAMCTWLLTMIVAIAAAQGALLKRKWMLRPAFALNRLRVPSWIIFAAAITGVMAVYAPAPYDYIGLNLALVLGVPFFFTGLAVVHAWAASTRAPTVILVIFYIVISVIVHLVLLVAMLGAVDQWVDFRKRFADKSLTKKK